MNTGSKIGNLMEQKVYFLAQDTGINDRGRLYAECPEDSSRLSEGSK